jgi:hypothetical protein
VEPANQGWQTRITPKLHYRWATSQEQGVKREPYDLIKGPLRPQHQTVSSGGQEVAVYRG